VNNVYVCACVCVCVCVHTCVCAWVHTDIYILVGGETFYMLSYLYRYQRWWYYNYVFMIVVEVIIMYCIWRCITVCVCMCVCVCVCVCGEEYTPSFLSPWNQSWRWKSRGCKEGRGDGPKQTGLCSVLTSVHVLDWPVMISLVSYETRRDVYVCMYVSMNSFLSALFFPVSLYGRCIAVQASVVLIMQWVLWQLVWR